MKARVRPKIVPIANEKIAEWPVSSIVKNEKYLCTTKNISNAHARNAVSTSKRVNGIVSMGYLKTPNEYQTLALFSVRDYYNT